MKNRIKTVPVINGKLILEAKWIEGNSIRLTATHATSGDVVKLENTTYRHERGFATTLLEFEVAAISEVNNKSSLDWPFDLAGWEEK